MRRTTVGRDFGRIVNELDRAVLDVEAGSAESFGHLECRRQAFQFKMDGIWRVNSPATFHLQSAAQRQIQ